MHMHVMSGHGTNVHTAPVGFKSHESLGCSSLEKSKISLSPIHLIAMPAAAMKLQSICSKSWEINYYLCNVDVMGE